MTSLLPEDHFKVLCYIDEHWLKREEFPSLSKIATSTKVPQTKVVEALSNPQLQKSLDIRGIPWQSDNLDKLSPEQVAYIRLVFNTSDLRSPTAKLHALGINPNTLAGWRKQKHFRDAYREEAERLFGNHMPDIHKALVDKAMDGDMVAIKQIYAMQGYWDDKATVETMNIRFVMVKLLETIQKHVKDPVALQAIASEFEGLVQEGQKALH